MFVTNNENDDFIKQSMLQWLQYIPKGYNPMNINQIYFSIIGWNMSSVLGETCRLMISQQAQHQSPGIGQFRFFKMFPGLQVIETTFSLQSHSLKGSIQGDWHLQLITGEHSIYSALLVINSALVQGDSGILPT